jgi:hypothetical protein
MIIIIVKAIERVVVKKERQIETRLYVATMRQKTHRTLAAERCSSISSNSSANNAKGVLQMVASCLHER